jgi:hypothetical protein
MCSDICGVSPTNKCLSDVGAPGRAARSRNSEGLGQIDIVPSDLGSLPAIWWLLMFIAQFSWLYAKAGRSAVNLRGTRMCKEPFSYSRSSVFSTDTRKECLTFKAKRPPTFLQSPMSRSLASAHRSLCASNASLKQIVHASKSRRNVFVSSNVCTGYISSFSFKLAVVGGRCMHCFKKAIVGGST